MINSTPINTVAINAAGLLGNPAEYVIETFFADTPAIQWATWIKVIQTYFASDAAAVNYAAKFRSRVNVATNMATYYNPQAEVTDLFGASAFPLAGFTSQFTDTYGAAAETNFVQVASLADALVATGAVQSFYHGVLEVLSTIGAAARVRPADYGFGDDEVSVDTLAVRFAYATKVLETVLATSAISNVLTIVVEETAALEAADSVELTARLLAELVDEVDIFSLLKLPSDVAQGWVMNTEGEMPISEYNNFQFDSLTEYKGVLYGTSDAGLYAMGADTDAGQRITAEIASLMLDFGTSRQKRIRSAYLGYTSENEMVLKVRSVDNGQLYEHWYKACPVTAIAPREGRIHVGQGLRSRYWQFELTNVDGGDFEIDQLEMYPLVLTRRV